MSEDLASRDRTAIWFAYLSPVLGIPLAGPWIAHALLDDDAAGRPYVARAFDLHLFTIVGGVAVMIFGFFIHPEGAVIVAGALMTLSIAVGFALLFGALKGSRWASPWQPVVLGGRSRYRSEPYVGPL